MVLRLEAEGETPLPPGKTFADCRAKTITDIRDAAEAHHRRHGFPTYVVGEPVQVYDMFRYVQDDGRTLGWASSLLLVVVILVLFRNLRWVLLPVFVVQATLVWTKAILVASQIQLTMVS